MFAKLFKPKWQHKDAKVRIQALAALANDSQELIHLAQNDPDTGVRLEAIARLAHLPTLIELGQRSDSIGERARTRVLTLAGTEKQYDDALVEVFDWLKSDESLLKNLVADGTRHVDLRRQAIELVDDENQLYQIAYDDQSREIQFIAASKISDTEKLKKLEKQHGRQNKRLRQLLKERLAVEEERQSFLSEVTACCEELEQLGQSGRWAQDKTQLLVLKQRWQQFNDVPESLSKRFSNAEKQFQCRLDTHEEEENKLQPLRNAFEALLVQAEQQLEQLQSQPEHVVLAEFDQAVTSNQAHWNNQAVLPEPHQAPLDEKWQALNEKIQKLRHALGDDLQALDQLRQIIEAAQKQQQKTKPLQAKKILELQSEWTSIKRPQTLRDQIDELEGKFQQSISSLNARLGKESKQRDQAINELTEDFTMLDELIEKEQYSHAVDLFQSIRARLHDADLPQKTEAQFSRKLQKVAPQINEWRDWRRWGTDQAREHLIESADQLKVEEELDPQERAKRVQAMRKAWRQLNEIEPGQQHKLWKTFDEKVTAAYEPSKQHFAEQAQQRQENLKAREIICEQLEALNADTDWNAVNWRDVQQKINQQRKKWKQAGSVSHKDWQIINERFNKAMDDLEIYLSKERNRNWQERLGLVEQVETLLELDDLQEATEQAKHLQGKWNITIPSRQGDEQRLWKRFRSPMDELFNRLKEQRNTARSEQQSLIEQKESLCAQVESWLELTGDDFKAAVKTHKDVSIEFNAVEGLPNAINKRLENRWQRANTALSQKRRQVKLDQQLAELDQLAPTPSEGDDASMQGEQLCLELEILLDLETPEAYQEQRMQYQVARLSESMTSLRDEKDPQDEALKLMRQWHNLSMNEQSIEQQQPRILAVRQALGTTA